MKIQVVGGTGGVGSRLVPPLKEAGHDVTAYGSWQVSLSNNSLNSDWKPLDAECLIFLAVSNHNAMLHKARPVHLEDDIYTNCTGLARVLKVWLNNRRDLGGRFIFTSSILTKQPRVGTAVYAASKAFGEQLVRCAALENGHRGITCNVIRMGYFDTGLWETIPDEIQEHIVSGIPAARTGNVRELAKLVEAIIDNDYLNGAVIDLAGGL